MKNSKKIWIAAAAVVLITGIVCGCIFGLGTRKVEPLGEDAEDTALIGFTWEYVLAQAPYTDACVFETQIGLERYWRSSWKGGSAIEAVLQQSKDGELIVLSETLPGRSNSAILYGEDKGVADLTLKELKKLNLAYNFEDADGMMTYKATPDVFLNEVAVLTLSEFADFFTDPQRGSAHLYFRFLDENAIQDLAAAVRQLYDTLEEKGLLQISTFCPAGDAMRAILDESYPDQSRTATLTEAEALAKAARRGKLQDTLPYEIVLVPAEGRFKTEQFIHFARNRGLIVLLEGASAEEVGTLYRYGVSGLASGSVNEFITLLDDAESAALKAESTTN